MKEPQSVKKRVDVGCALIVRGEELLIAQRKPGTNLAGYWEFPGGKREAGESLEDCLVREVWEELGVVIRPRRQIRADQHEMPERVLDLYFYVCDWISGAPYRKDCLDFKWVRAGELRKYRFPPADLDLIRDLAVRPQYYLRRIV